MRTTLKEELRKIVHPLGRNEVFVGNSAYITLGDVKIRVDLFDESVSGNYNSLKIRAVNAKTGDVDTNVVRFLDVLGRKPTDNPNFPKGVAPYIWVSGDTVHWYVYQPTAADYKILTNEVKNYISVFE